MAGDPKQLRGVGKIARVGLLVIGSAGLLVDLVLRSGPRLFWLAAGVSLSLSVAANVVSWVTARARRLSRRRTNRYGLAPENFSSLGLMSSWTWDSLAVVLLSVGLALFAFSLL
jgi:hypothetical protein